LLGGIVKSRPQRPITRPAAVSSRLRLDDIRRARGSNDPGLVGLVHALASQPDEAPEAPVREEAPTFKKFLAEIRSKPFFKTKTPEEQRHYRVEQLKALESPDAEVPLPERLRLHEIVAALWEDNGPYARTCLLEIIARVPLRYGPWRALKRIFKEAEARDDTEVFGALAARIDAAQGEGHGQTEVGSLTLAYLRRRAWRYLRRIARTRPACYADAAADVLAHYQDSTGWQQTLVANHIFFHETGEYDRSSFHLKRPACDLLKDRAFADLWRRSPRPLFGLLERARSDHVRRFAAEALKADFRASLREVESGWVARLIGVRSGPVDEFAVWVLNNVPRFEQAAFRSLGLHEAVLRLFDSPSAAARGYAAEYARTHARDLPVVELIRLADNGEIAVRRLASDLLQARDPRKEIGLEAWGRLLESSHGHELASTILRKHFGAKELTPEWFAERLFAVNQSAFQFIQTLLFQTHPAPSLGAGYFVKLIEEADRREGRFTPRVTEFAMSQLVKFDLSTLDRDALRRMILRPLSSPTIGRWIDEGRLKLYALGLDFLRAIAFHPDWDADPWISSLRREGPTWTRKLDFDESLSERILGWLRDVRQFAPADLGFEWLLRLASRSEARYHDFAVDTMIKGFTPADFAPKPNAAPASASVAAPASVNLGGASFLFTGKMATMQRKEAEDNVRNLGGSVASGVTNKLHYLVIGDEGSPLYGHGKKGSKQVKGEELNAAGANIKIVSETAFLKMLAGPTPQATEGSSLDGALRLWEMAGAPGPADAPLAQFAIKYIRRHHPDIALAETDRPVDPGSEIPAEFLTFERVEPLFRETRKPLRDLALELARWEFARWSPPSDELVRLAENPHADVRKFVAGALLADDAPEHRRYRIDLEKLGPAAVFRFCESGDESTRALGIQLIGRSPRFRLPEELFRLTESPDRRVRAFVIRTLWSLYRNRGISDDWKPYIRPAPSIGAAAAKKAAARAEVLGTGPPARPEQRPSTSKDLWSFLRRTLFEIPPPRPEKRQEVGTDPGDRLKPLAARKAKLALIETMRDLALEDADFARGVLPLMEEFMVSRGRSERDACLVAVTRLRHVHPGLKRIERGGDS
jgi:hypothetical protein